MDSSRKRKYLSPRSSSSVKEAYSPPVKKGRLSKEPLDPLQLGTAEVPVETLEASTMDLAVFSAKVRQEDVCRAAEVDALFTPQALALAATNETPVFAEIDVVSLDDPPEIDASWVLGGRFIVAAHPTKAADFWKMVLYPGKTVDAVVMFGNAEPSYWPQHKETETYGDISVTCLAEYTVQRIVRRILVIKDAKVPADANVASTHVSHFHLVDWPEAGSDVLAPATKLQWLVGRLKKNKTPTVVHGPAAGAFILAAELSRTGGSAVDLTKRLRTERAGLVASKNEFELALKCL